VLNIANDSDSISIDVNDVSSDTEASEYIERNNIDSSNQTESPSTVDHSESNITEISDDDSLNISLNIENVSESVIEEPVIDNKVIKSKKPFITVVAIGLIVLVAISLMLIFSGVLSTSAVDDESNNRDSETKVATDSLPVVSAEPIATNDDNQLAADTNDSDTPLESATQDALNNGKGTPAEEPIEITSETESAITYEDFRQESQTTLYREASD
jgi:hypothetical protein